MHKLALQLTRGVKELGLSILTLGSSVLIAACYGAQYAGEQMVSIITGNVRDQGQGVAGIQVCASTTNGGGCATTDANGYYDVMVDTSIETEAWEDGCKLQVQDIDGADNGEYAPAEVDVPPETVPTVVDVDLVPAVN